MVFLWFSYDKWVPSMFWPMAIWSQELAMQLSESRGSLQVTVTVTSTSARLGDTTKRRNASLKITMVSTIKHVVRWFKWLCLFYLFSPDDLSWDGVLNWICGRSSWVMWSPAPNWLVWGAKKGRLQTHKSHRKCTWPHRGHFPIGWLIDW